MITTSCSQSLSIPKTRRWKRCNYVVSTEISEKCQSDLSKRSDFSQHFREDMCEILSEVFWFQKRPTILWLALSLYSALLVPMFFCFKSNLWLCLASLNYIKVHLEQFWKFWRFTLTILSRDQNDFSLVKKLDLHTQTVFYGLEKQFHGLSELVPGAYYLLFQYTFVPFRYI